MYDPRAQDKPGGFFPTVNRSPDAAKKFSHVTQYAKSIMYNTDGSGRDGYVTCGNGGFTNPNKVVACDPRVVFARGLRCYERDDTYLQRRNHNSKRRQKSNATASLRETMEAVDQYNKAYNGYD